MINAALLGRLTADPQQRQAGQYNFVTFTVATNRSRKDRNGEYATTFVNCSLFGQRGEFVTNYFHKGQMIFVCGELYEDRWQDSDGNQRQSTRMDVSNVTFGEPKSDNDYRQQGNQSAPKLNDDDMPF